MDHWRGKHFFIQISAKDKVALYCQEDNSENCVHVGFCYALPQVYKALIKKGFRPPKYYAERRNIEGTIDYLEHRMRDNDRKDRKRRQKQGWSAEQIAQKETETVETIEDVRGRMLEPDA